jgi:hypothetical protein
MDEQDSSLIAQESEIPECECDLGSFVERQCSRLEVGSL